MVTIYNENTATTHETMGTTTIVAMIYYHNTPTTHNNSNSLSHVLPSVPGQVSQHNASFFPSLNPRSSCHVTVSDVATKQ